MHPPRKTHWKTRQTEYLSQLSLASHCHQSPWKWHNGHKNRVAKVKAIYRPNSMYLYVPKLASLVRSLNRYRFSNRYQCWAPVMVLCVYGSSQPLSGKPSTSSPIDLRTVGGLFSQGCISIPGMGLPFLSEKPQLALPSRDLRKAQPMRMEP